MHSYLQQINSHYVWLQDQFKNNIPFFEWTDLRDLSLFKE
jgi:hypothetical protein